MAVNRWAGAGYGAGPAPADPQAVEHAGELARVRNVFANEDETVTVVASLADGTTVRGNLAHQGELVTGGYYLFLGRWVEHQRYGWQFSFEAWAPDHPVDLQALAAFLARHLRGVGLATARRLTAAYGADAARVLLEDPARAAADGLLADALAREAAERLGKILDPKLRDAQLELYGLLRGHGFHSAVAIKQALLLWGEHAPAVVRRDPFHLLVGGVPSAGFSRCDRLYLSLGRPAGRLKRQALAVWDEVRRRDGDTWVDITEAFAAVRRKIGGASPRERRAVALAIRSGLLECRLGPDLRHWLAERDKAIDERGLARLVRQMTAAGQPTLWPQAQAGDLSEHQAAEIRKALTSRLAVLTGNPGTGKTHAAAVLIRELVRRHGADRVAVCAFSGKATVRIGEKLREHRVPLEPTTIHGLLRVRGKRHDGSSSFGHGPDSPLPHQFVIVDEVSMLDVGLACSLLGALARDSHVLLVGDKHQLPPIGHGAFLRDVIDAGVPTARLTEIRRNAGRIVTACGEVKAGVSPRLDADLNATTDENNLVQLPLGSPAEGVTPAAHLMAKVGSVLDWVRGQPEPCDLIRDVQVVCARNATRKALNRELQRILNPDGRPVYRVFREGDKVINLKNGKFALADGPARQEYVANGDMGTVAGARGRQLLVKLAIGGKTIAAPVKTATASDATAEDPADLAADDEDDAGTGCSWDLAYAVTCHKAQGSEWPVAVVVVEPCGPLGSREWLYTAVSRARRLCVLLGDPQAVAGFVRRETLPDRKTFLKELIRGGCS